MILRDKQECVVGIESIFAVVEVINKHDGDEWYVLSKEFFYFLF